MHHNPLSPGERMRGEGQHSACPAPHPQPFSPEGEKGASVADLVL